MLLENAFREGDGQMMQVMFIDTASRRHAHGPASGAGWARLPLGGAPVGRRRMCAAFFWLTIFKVLFRTVFQPLVTGVEARSGRERLVTRRVGTKGDTPCADRVQNEHHSPQPSTDHRPLSSTPSETSTPSESKHTVQN